MEATFSWFLMLKKYINSKQKKSEIKKKNRIKEVVSFFSVDFNPVRTNGILDIQKYLMKRKWYKIMLGLIKKIFIGWLTGLVNGSNHTKCILLSNQKYMIQSTLINLDPNEYSQEIPYYRFQFKLQWCVGSCIALIDSFNKECNNKTEDFNITVFDMIASINEAKTLTKHISCECKCKFDGAKCKSNQM